LNTGATVSGSQLSPSGQSALDEHHAPEALQVPSIRLQVPKLQSRWVQVALLLHSTAGWFLHVPVVSPAGMSQVSATQDTARSLVQVPVSTRPVQVSPVGQSPSTKQNFVAVTLQTRLLQEPLQ
jgi:hypothetical protein